jgi:hypothetical protein
MSDTEERLTEYCLHGGLYNPELMQHDKVRDLLIDCRDEIAAEIEQLREAIRSLAEQDATLSVQERQRDGDDGCHANRRGAGGD